MHFVPADLVFRFAFQDFKGMLPMQPRKPQAKPPKPSKPLKPPEVKYQRAVAGRRVPSVVYLDAASFTATFCFHCPCPKELIYDCLQRALAAENLRCYHYRTLPRKSVRIMEAWEREAEAICGYMEQLEERMTVLLVSELERGTANDGVGRE